MRKFATFFVLALAALMPLAATAQDDRDHIEIGAFADYLRLQNAGDANYVGFGGRIGFGIASHVNLEAQIGYDPAKAFTAGAGSLTGGSISATAKTTNLRLLHGLFGPMIWFGTKHARIFGEVKGGFLNFSTSPSFTSTFGSVTNGNTDGVFYPGGGAELSVGPIGLRLDVGDMMYFDNGAKNNLSVQFGPTFHF